MRLEGRKDKTLRGVITASTPVLGFRPRRSFFDCTEKVPNEDSLTESPEIRHSVTSSSRLLTRCEHSLCDSPICWCTALAKSLRVIVLSILKPYHWIKSGSIHQRPIFNLKFTKKHTVLSIFFKMGDHSEPEMPPRTIHPQLLQRQANPQL